jgi:hypothetical protein
VTHPLVERILKGELPGHLKKAAARGALPIPREDLLELWVLLRNDPDGEVRLACKESLAEVSEEEWKEVLPQHPFDPRVLDFAVRVLGKNPPLLTAVLQNRGVPVEALEWLGGNGPEQALELLLENQVRLIQSPAIVAGMLRNPALTPTLVRRIFDLSEQFFRDHPLIPMLLEEKFGLKLGLAGGTFEAPGEEPEEPEGEAPALPPEEELLPPPPEGEELYDEIPLEALSEESLTQEEFRSLYQRILRMSVPAKIELALKGNKEARGLLIRDSNKVVQMAVLDSPKLTEVEVESIARMRNVPDEVLRKMARNQEWMKKYPILKGLATNPKTPPGIAIALVRRLLDFDLRLLLKDKGVSDVVRREAKKTFEARHTRKDASFKKH